MTARSWWIFALGLVGVTVTVAGIGTRWGAAAAMIAAGVLACLVGLVLLPALAVSEACAAAVAMFRKLERELAIDELSHAFVSNERVRLEITERLKAAKRKAGGE